MRRREFIAGLASAALLPATGRAQQRERVRRLGVIMAINAEDPMTIARMAILRSALQELGWVEGRNLHIDLRTAAGTDHIRANIAELIALQPDIIVSGGAASLAQVLQATRTIPVVFANVADPVGAGFIESLAEPGGNATGFLVSEYGLSGKLVELLKQLAPGVTRAAVLRDPTITAAIGQFAVIQSVAPALGIDVRTINVRDAAGIERGITAFARGGSGGLIVPFGATASTNRATIIALAAQHRLPAVYNTHVFVRDGGLVSYGPDNLALFRPAAGYIDRILKGEKPADLPVQAPTRYELRINLKTAKALGLEIPATLLARADEVIE